MNFERREGKSCVCLHLNHNFDLLFSNVFVCLLKRNHLKQRKKVEKRIVLIMDNLVLISKKNIAKHDWICELQK